MTKASARARPNAAVAPRGQKSNPTTMLTAQPMATSSILVRPTFHPTGSMMLNRMITTKVKPACPAANEIIDGATPEISTARGRRTHRSAAWPGTPIITAEPTTKPTAVPPTARRAVAPVPSAFDLSTDSVPRTTQKPCSTSVTSTTATAKASPAAPRTALRNQTDGKSIQGWIVKPPAFDAAKKYPLLVAVDDAPRRMCGSEFRLRAQIFAARGFVVLCANPRGTPGYGEEFGNLIRSRFPGDDFDDLMRGVDHLIARGYIDPGRLAISGGLLAAWAIGHTARFHAAVVRHAIADWLTDVAHAPDGIYRAAAWMGAMPWDDPDQYVKHSPVYFAGNFRTPTLVIAGAADPGAEELYFALQAKKVDSALLRLGDEGRPSQVILGWEATLAWLER